MTRDMINELITCRVKNRAPRRRKPPCLTKVPNRSERADTFVYLRIHRALEIRSRLRAEICKAAKTKTFGLMEATLFL